MLEVINYFEPPAYVVKRRKKMNLSFLIVNMNRRKTFQFRLKMAMGTRNPKPDGFLLY